MRRLIFLLLPFLLLGRLTGAAPVPSDPDAAVVAGKAFLPGLRLTLRTDKAAYEQDEAIPITLRYTYDGTRALSVLVVTYNRSGRIQEFGFQATDTAGKTVPDPTPFRGGMGGGLRGETKLTPTRPYEQTVTLNEWLRFDAPGRYTVIAESGIIRLDDGTGWGGPSIPLKSEPLTLEITASDDAHRQARLAQDRANLTSPDRQTRLNALRDLRFLVDTRAIPLLVQALNEDDTNLMYEAWFGLRAFPDMAPIKTELLRVIADHAHPVAPGRQWPYRNLLSEADQRLSGKPPTPEQDKRYDALFALGMQTALAAATPGRAAELTVEGMALANLSRTDPANWRRVLDHAALMSSESQSYAASLLESGLEYPKDFPDLKALRSLKPELRRVGANPRLSPELRSGAITALHTLGDDSFRNLLVSDLTAPKPVFSDAAHRTLGGYQAGEIGRRLLMLAASPDDDTRRSAAERLRDFGTAVSAASLRALLARQAAGADNYDATARDALLEALALKSPADALPLIAREVSRPNRPYSGVSDVPIRLACRLRGPDARRIVRGLLASPRPETRQTAAQALDESQSDAARLAGGGPTGETGRRLPPDSTLAASYFPELLALARDDPSASVRAAARQALIGITGLPKGGDWQATAAQQQSWSPLWENWWRQNQSKFRQE